MNRPQQKQQQQHPQEQQRRIFRGRGGPTDRRLPKHNARRRRRTTTTTTTITSTSTTTDLIEAGSGNDEVVNYESNENNVQVQVDDDQIYIQEEEEVIVDEVKEVVTKNISSEDVDPAYRNEMNHLLQRIQNNKKSMSLSNEALANINNYQKNVLYACSNTINEWISIIKHYNNDDKASNNKDEQKIRRLVITDKDLHIMSLAIFELIQQSVQCGPLTGSKPGYFKRCGSEVALIVYEYLNTIMDHITKLSEKDLTIGLTEKQMNNINKWKINAQKASSENNNKSTSKFVLKKQEKVIHTNKKNKKNDNK